MNEPFNAGDKAHVEKRKRKEEIQRDRELADLREVLDSAAGRRLLWRLLGHCGVYRSTFSTNALQMATSEGQRNVGLFLTAEIMEADTSKYLLMQNESISKETKNV